MRTWMYWPLLGVTGLVLSGLALGPRARAQEGDAVDPAQRTVERFIAALEAKDIKAISALLDDRMSIVQPLSFSGDAADAVRFDGKEASLGYFRGVTTRMGRIRFVDAELSAVDGGRAVFYEATGDLTTADGAPYRNVYVFKFELSGGRIVRVVEYANPVTFALTFGFPLGPEATPAASPTPAGSR